ncbi:MAG: RluA family pseudouridine synthase [Clostridiaceae bacterium]
MDNLLTFNIGSEDAGSKLRDFLKFKCNFSSRFCRVSAYGQNIFVNKNVVRLSYILKENDVVEIKLNKEESQNIEPEDIKLDIVYEDQDLIVINKPPFIVVHPTKSHPNNTIANGLIHYFREKGENCIVRLVNRLDMNTSGLLIVAKNQFSHMALQRDMNEDTFKKQYLALTHGSLPEDKGTIDLPILNAEDNGIKRTIDRRGQRSVTHYEVVERYKEAQLVRLTLETGRTHQIRIHLSHLGCPIFGDILYGSEDKEYIQRQGLHAYKLQFPHPRDNRIIELESQLPSDMKELIEILNK